MGDAGKNSLWGSLTSSIDSTTGKISKDADDVSANILGPSYSYSDNIPTPDSLGVGSDGSFSQLGRNTSAVFRYVGELVDGDPLGNRFFVNTGGTCTAPDGSIQSRHNYVNNVASGLIPGIVDDIEGLNPFYLFTALTSDGSPACECYSCQTSDGSQSFFLSKTLTPDFNPSLCTQVDPSQCPSSESFVSRNHGLGPLLAAGTLLLVLIFSQKK
jgi:hypothetical protein